jgi:hypothetical protein
MKNYIENQSSKLSLKIIHVVACNGVSQEHFYRLLLRNLSNKNYSKDI